MSPENLESLFRTLKVRNMMIYSINGAMMSIEREDEPVIVLNENVLEYIREDKKQVSYWIEEIKNNTVSDKFVEEFLTRCMRYHIITPLNINFLLNNVDKKYVFSTTFLSRTLFYIFHLLYNEDGKTLYNEPFEVLLCYDSINTSIDDMCYHVPLDYKLLTNTGLSEIKQMLYTVIGQTRHISDNKEKYTKIVELSYIILSSIGGLYDDTLLDIEGIFDVIEYSLKKRLTNSSWFVETELGSSHWYVSLQILFDRFMDTGYDIYHLLTPYEEKAIIYVDYMLYLIDTKIFENPVNSTDDKRVFGGLSHEMSDHIMSFVGELNFVTMFFDNAMFGSSLL